MIYLLEEEDIPYEFEYSSSIRRFIELDLINFEVWRLIDKNTAKKRMEELMERYPDRQLIPFAKRDDCDDIACFEAPDNEKVYIVHDYASSGWEQREIFDSLWDWVRYIVDIMIEFEEIELMYDETGV